MRRVWRRVGGYHVVVEGERGELYESVHLVGQGGEAVVVQVQGLELCHEAHAHLPLPRDAQQLHVAHRHHQLPSQRRERG